MEKQLISRDNQEFKMKGIVLNDEEHELAKHMDRELKGHFISAKFVKNKNKIINVASLAEFGELARKIDSLIIQMGASLHSGDISQNPVDGKRHDKTCEMCDYLFVCMNRREIEKRETTDLTDEEVFEAIREENSDA